MSDTEVKEKVTRQRAELVEIDYDDIPDMVRGGRSSQLKQRVEKVKTDNTGKPRLIAKYHSAASASSTATAQRKNFAGQGFKFAVRSLDDGSNQTGLFVMWNSEWVGLDDAPKPRPRKKKAVAENPETPTEPKSRVGRR